MKLTRTTHEPTGAAAPEEDPLKLTTSPITITLEDLTLEQAAEISNLAQKWNAGPTMYRALSPAFAAAPAAPATAEVVPPPTRSRRVDCAGCGRKLPVGDPRCGKKSCPKHGVWQGAGPDPSTASSPAAEKTQAPAFREAEKAPPASADEPATTTAVNKPDEKAALRALGSISEASMDRAAPPPAMEDDEDAPPPDDEDAIPPPPAPKSSAPFGAEKTAEPVDEDFEREVAEAEAKVAAYKKANLEKKAAEEAARAAKAKPATEVPSSSSKASRVESSLEDVEVEVLGEKHGVALTKRVGANKTIFSWEVSSLDRTGAGFTREQAIERATTAISEAINAKRAKAKSEPGTLEDRFDKAIAKGDAEDAKTAKAPTPAKEAPAAEVSKEEGLIAKAMKKPTEFTKNSVGVMLALFRDKNGAAAANALIAKYDITRVLGIEPLPEKKG